MFETVAQKAIYELLLENDDIKTKTYGVFDFVDSAQEFPYITIGESVQNEWDTDNTLGHDCVMTVHVWARGGSGKGRKELKEIQGFIYKSLHRSEYSTKGFRFISVDFQDSQSLVDADGLTYHGIQNFRLLIDRVQ